MSSKKWRYCDSCEKEIEVACERLGPRWFSVQTANADGVVLKGLTADLCSYKCLAKWAKAWHRMEKADKK